MAFADGFDGREEMMLRYLAQSLELEAIFFIEAAIARRNERVNGEEIRDDD